MEFILDSEENIESLIDHTDEFPVTMVTMLLEAMQNNSSEARQRFPRLLQLVELYPACMDTLIRKVVLFLFYGFTVIALIIVSIVCYTFIISNICCMYLTKCNLQRI